MAQASTQTKIKMAAATAASEEAVPASAGTAAEGEPSGSAYAASSGGTRTPAPQGKVTKLSQIRALLATSGGASLSALCDATGWQSHSVRAALTGLRKAGATIEKSKAPDDTTVYRIAIGAEAAK